MTYVSTNMKATTTRDSSKLSQALPVLGLFILGMLAGTIYNRSGSGRAIQSAEDLRLVANPPAGGVGLAPVVNGLNGHDEVNSIKDDENDKNVFRESVPDFDPFAHQTSSVADRTGPIENVDLVSLDGKVEEEDSSTETSDHHSIARKEKCKSESSEYTHGQVSRICCTEIPITSSQRQTTSNCPGLHAQGLNKLCPEQQKLP